MSPETVIEFICKDVRGIVVTCLNTQWQYLLKHPEMEGQQGVVRAIIEAPEFIHRSRDYKDRHTYYKQVVLSGIGNTYIRVIVKVNSWLKRGQVYNAFAVKGPQEGETLIWKRS